ncbi:DUF2817 domain-containing protein [Archangium violaceum]|uniref:DUF2817 domain-containing protein n=1 Tax=Archangium violaceum TaxID=83451 RepID=UPI00193C0E4A|nr:DUF2817 domain-containing protein [Archangium violaceum]QRK05692.1 DUF2817 domain-containing protein [Archangium violaceum]
MSRPGTTAGAELFSPDYAVARDRFRAACADAGFQAHCYPMPASASGVELTVDVAVGGTVDARRALLVTSGLHGVEGFIGSALQLAFLQRLAVDHSCANGLRLVFVHALNPFGFHMLRRTDERNVDLNRNFLLPSEEYRGVPEAYWDVQRLLGLSAAAPASGFLPLNMLRCMLRHGQAVSRDAVAGGQYEDSWGLFFGGSELSPTGSLLETHLRGWLGDATEVLHVDIHSGLGPWGRYRLILEHDWETPELYWFGRHFGESLVEPSEPKLGISYRKRGGLGPWCAGLLAPRAYELLIAEFGTYPLPLVLLALRAENRDWLRGREGLRRRLVKAALREVFAPVSPRWRAGVIQRGLELLHRAADVCRAEGVPTARSRTNPQSLSMPVELPGQRIPGWPV